MWLFTNNNDVRKRNFDKLVKTSKYNKVFVARLEFACNTRKFHNGREISYRQSHIDPNTYLHCKYLCVGSRVAIRNWNILPLAGLYNGSIGTVVEIL